MNKMIDSCQVSAAHVVMMVSNILDYSKMAEGKLTPNYKPENVLDLVKNAVELHKQKLI